MPERMTEQVILQILVVVGVILRAGIPAYFGYKPKLVEMGKDARDIRGLRDDHQATVRL